MTDEELKKTIDDFVNDEREERIHKAAEVALEPTLFALKLLRSRPSLTKQEFLAAAAEGWDVAAAHIARVRELAPK